MTPTFEQVVDWLKSLESEQSPQQQPFPGQFSHPYAQQKAQGSRAKKVAFPSPVQQGGQEGSMTRVAPTSEISEASAQPTAVLRPSVVNLSAGRLVQGIIMSEILGRPVSRRRRRHFGDR